jgi:hypothetical protein
VGRLCRKLRLPACAAAPGGRCPVETRDRRGAQRSAAREIRDQRSVAGGRGLQVEQPWRLVVLPPPAVVRQRFISRAETVGHRVENSVPLEELVAAGRAVGVCVSQSSRLSRRAHQANRLPYCTCAVLQFRLAQGVHCFVGDVRDQCRRFVRTWGDGQ